MEKNGQECSVHCEVHRSSHDVDDEETGVEGALQTMPTLVRQSHAATIGKMGGARCLDLRGVHRLAIGRETHVVVTAVGAGVHTRSQHVQR